MENDETHAFLKANKNKKILTVLGVLGGIVALVAIVLIYIYILVPLTASEGYR